MLRKVISGGQTGADLAGLLAAKEVGILTGGWMPKGFRNHTGDHPDFASIFSILETNSHGYSKRTELNVQHSDATIRFARVWDSPGELCTLKYIQIHSKPRLDIDPWNTAMTPMTIAKLLLNRDIKVLNIAGNSERTAPGIQELVRIILLDTFKIIRDVSSSLANTRS